MNAAGIGTQHLQEGGAVAQLVQRRAPPPASLRWPSISTKNTYSHRPEAAHGRDSKLAHRNAVRRRAAPAGRAPRPGRFCAEQTKRGLVACRMGRHRGRPATRKRVVLLGSSSMLPASMLQAVAAAPPPRRRWRRIAGLRPPGAPPRRCSPPARAAGSAGCGSATRGTGASDWACE